MDENIEITLEQVKEFLSQNKDKAELITIISDLGIQIPVTSEAFEAFSETKEGQELLQPKFDKRVTQAIDTYKKGKFESEVKARVAAELLKVNPSETPEQKQLREMREEMQKDKQDRERERLQAQIKEKAFEEKINPAFISGINFNSVEEAALYMKNLKVEFEGIEKKVTNDLLANGSYKPKAGETKDKGPNIAAMSPKEKFEYFKAEAEKREAEANAQG